MFDIGFLEMLTIGVVALVVIGPERLPEVAAKVGRYVGKAQRFVRGVRSDISRELESGDLKKLIGDQKSQIDELRQMVHSATKDLEESTGGAMKDAQRSLSDMKTDVSDSLKSKTEVPASANNAAGSESAGNANTSEGGNGTSGSSIDSSPDSTTDSTTSESETQQKSIGS